MLARCSGEPYDSSLRSIPRFRTLTFGCLNPHTMARSLDDSFAVSRIDSKDMLGAVARFPEYLSEPGRFLGAGSAGREKSYDNIALAGMGGSASAGDFLQDWLRDRMEMELVVLRQPRLPRNFGRRTLLIAMSYSGNTWETLSAFRMAKNRGCRMVAVSSGGKLNALCNRWGVPFIRLDTGLAPRAAMPQMIQAGVVALQESGVVSRCVEELTPTGEELRQLRRKVGIEVPFSKNRAKLFASKLLGKVPAVYSLYRMSSVARRFKNQLAENSKVLAMFGLLPEACHNELEAWGNSAKLTLPIVIRDSVERREESALLDTFSEVVQKATGLRPLEVRVRSESALARLLAPVLFLDYVSVYLAILRGVDPSPVPTITFYKERYASVTRAMAHKSLR